jgi:uncharacterized repeat protein (TIGR03803 family)
MKRISIVVLILCACFVPVAWGQQPAAATTIGAQAQTYSVLYTFTGGQDGANPIAGLAMDRAGNLYGTAELGGGGGLCNGNGCGTVFKLVRKGSGWVLISLYGFTGGNDGAFPQARVTIRPNNSFYSTTAQGGAAGCDSGCGTVFNLRPANARTETVLHQFGTGADGFFPYGDLTFDQAGNIYGTTSFGGVSKLGTVYVLKNVDGQWQESVIYSFSGSDGASPSAGVIFDNAGNIYGTTTAGSPVGYGTVFQLTRSDSGWTEKTLYAFQNGSDGAYPVGGLIFDRSGNLYGTTSAAGSGSGGGGTVFRLRPNSDGSWTFNVLYSFSGNYGGGPQSTLVMDSERNLYGTTQSDGAHSFGSVFKLTRSGHMWTYFDLYDFTFGSDGYLPYGSLILDANGNLYGTTAQGGNLSGCMGNGCGVVFEITPKRR